MTTVGPGATVTESEESESPFRLTVSEVDEVFGLNCSVRQEIAVLETLVTSHRVPSPKTMERVTKLLSSVGKLVPVILRVVPPSGLSALLGVTAVTVRGIDRGLTEEAIGMIPKSSMTSGSQSPATEAALQVIEVALACTCWQG